MFPSLSHLCTGTSTCSMLSQPSCCIFAGIPWLPVATSSVFTWAAVGSSLPARYVSLSASILCLSETRQDFIQAPPFCEAYLRCSRRCCCTGYSTSLSIDNDTHEVRRQIGINVTLAFVSHRIWPPFEEFISAC